MHASLLTIVTELYPATLVAICAEQGAEAGCYMG